MAKSAQVAKYATLASDRVTREKLNSICRRTGLTQQAVLSLLIESIEVKRSPDSGDLVVELDPAPVEQALEAAANG